jgi:hypothetical protein
VDYHRGVRVLLGRCRGVLVGGGGLGVVWVLLYVSPVCKWFGAGQVRGGIAWACGSGVVL